MITYSKADTTSGTTGFGPRIIVVVGRHCSTAESAIEEITSAQGVEITIQRDEGTSYGTQPDFICFDDVVDRLIPPPKTQDHDESWRERVVENNRYMANLPPRNLLKPSTERWIYRDRRTAPRWKAGRWKAKT